MTFKVYVAPKARAKYEPYKGRLVVIVRVSKKGNSDVILLTDRTMDALNNADYAMLATDGNGRFALRASAQNAPGAMKMRRSGGGALPTIYCNSFIRNEFPTPIEHGQSYSLVYPANVDDQGWVVVDTVKDHPSRR